MWTLIWNKCKLSIEILLNLILLYTLIIYHLLFLIYPTYFFFKGLIIYNLDLIKNVFPSVLVFYFDKNIICFSIFSTHFFIKHSNNLLYFSTCLPRALECLALLIVVFRLFKNSVEAPYNIYTSRIPKRAHKIWDGNLFPRQVRTTGHLPLNVRNVESLPRVCCLQPFHLLLLLPI